MPKSFESVPWVCAFLQKSSSDPHLLLSRPQAASVPQLPLPYAIRASPHGCHDCWCSVRAPRIVTVLRMGFLPSQVNLKLNFHIRSIQAHKGSLKEFIDGERKKQRTRIIMSLPLPVVHLVANLPPDWISTEVFVSLFFTRGFNPSVYTCLRSAFQTWILKVFHVTTWASYTFIYLMVLNVYF